MLWVLKRTVSLRRFFWAPKRKFKLMEKEKKLHLSALKLFIWGHEYEVANELNQDLGNPIAKILFNID